MTEDKDVTEISDKVVDVKKIANPRLKQIIESYRREDGFLFFGGRRSTRIRGHLDEWEPDHKSYWDEWGHSETGSHQDYKDSYDDYMDSVRRNRHHDHTDAPRVYHEGPHHTDSNSPRYRK